MFDKAYFEKDFPKLVERFKKEAGVDNPKVVFVCGHSHLIVTEIAELKDNWLSCWVYDGEYKTAGRSPVLMMTRYDQIRQIFLFPLKGEHVMGFRAQK